MKKLFVFAAALGLFASIPASAQSNDHQGDKRDTSSARADHRTPHAATHQNDQGRATARQGGQGRVMTTDTHTKSANTRENWSGNAVAGTGNMKSKGSHQAGPAANTSSNRFLPGSGNVRSNPSNRSTADRARYNSGWSGNAAEKRPVVNSRQGNWSGNSSGHPPDINALRRNMQASQRFRHGSYNAPQGYQYRHWGYGERLPHGYFVRDYWITDFIMFGLFAPPPDLIWVRVGDDALLIDRYSGDIVQVRYGVFY